MMTERRLWLLWIAVVADFDFDYFVPSLQRPKNFGPRRVEVVVRAGGADREAIPLARGHRRSSILMMETFPLFAFCFLWYVFVAASFLNKNHHEQKKPNKNGLLVDDKKNKEKTPSTNLIRRHFPPLFTTARVVSNIFCERLPLP
jgi:hypothetical protein